MKKTVPFQIRFPEEILEQLKNNADNQHTTSSEIVRRLVIDYLKASQTNSKAPNTEVNTSNEEKDEDSEIPF